MSAVTYLTEADDWNRALNEAKSLETLRAVVAGWAPYVPDAQQAVDEMGAREFEQFRVGLAIERKGNFAGEEWAERFGPIAVPDNLLRGSLMASNFKVPLGTALIRMHEQGLLEVPA